MNEDLNAQIESKVKEILDRELEARVAEALRQKGREDTPPLTRGREVPPRNGPAFQTELDNHQVSRPRYLLSSVCNALSSLSGKSLVNEPKSSGIHRTGLPSL